MTTWDLEQEVVGHRVARSSLLDDDVGQEVVVVDRNGSVVVHNQCWSFFWDLLHPVDLIAWYTGQRSQGVTFTKHNDTLTTQHLDFTKQTGKTFHRVCKQLGDL